MNMTLNLWTIVEKWAGILRQSEKLEAFCQERYGRTFKLYLGADPKEPPDEGAAPYIMIIPSGKEEGADESENTYTLFVYACIYQAEREADGENVRNDAEEGAYDSAKTYILPGEKEIIDFSELIYNELQDKLLKHPVSTYDLDIVTGTTFPQFSSLLTLQTVITPAMGEELVY